MSEVIQASAPAQPFQTEAVGLGAPVFASQTLALPGAARPMGHGAPNAGSALRVAHLERAPDRTVHNILWTTVSTTWDRRLEPFHSDFVSHLLSQGLEARQKPLHIIDFGIGEHGAPETWNLADMLSRAGFTQVTLTGIDALAVNVTSAEMRRRPTPGVQVILKVGTVASLEPESADILIVGNVLFHYDAEKYDAMVRWLLRALKPVGRLYEVSGPSKPGRGFPIRVKEFMPTSLQPVACYRFMPTGVPPEALDGYGTYTLDQLKYKRFPEKLPTEPAKTGLDPTRTGASKALQSEALELHIPLNPTDRQRIVRLFGRLLGFDDQQWDTLESSTRNTVLAKAENMMNTWSGVSASNVVWVLRDEARIIHGYLWAKPNTLRTDKKSVMLHHVVLSSAFENAGWATYLIREAVRFLRQRPGLEIVEVKDESAGQMAQIVTTKLDEEDRFQPHSDPYSRQHGWYELVLRRAT